MTQYTDEQHAAKLAEMCNMAAVQTYMSFTECPAKNVGAECMMPDHRNELQMSRHTQCMFIGQSDWLEYLGRHRSPCTEV
jgi:hypothetical protein